MNTFLNKNKTRLEKKLAVKQWMVGTSCRICLIIFTVAFSLLYLLQTNAVSSKGFEMSELEKQINELERETQKLDVEISRHRSIQSIEERLQNLEMVAADNVEYAIPVGTALARNE